MRRHPWTLLALLGMATLAGLMALPRPWPRMAPPCPLHHYTGLNCPGCGGTRSVVRLIHGDIGGSLAMNPLVTILACVSGIWLALAVWREWHGRPAPAPPMWSIWTLLGVILVFSLTRNLPWWPFTLLAPH